MSTTPNLRLPLLDTNQAQKELSVNEAFVILDALMGGVLDRDLTTPPVSPGEGDAYIPAATATGVWAGFENYIAYYFQSAWYFIDPDMLTGVILHVIDEDRFIRWSSESDGGYQNLNLVDPQPAQLNTQSGTSYTLTSSDEGTYMRFTNAGAKTVTVPSEEEESLPSDGEFHIRNVGAGDLTIEGSSDVTINIPYLGTLILLQGMTVTLKKVAADEFDLFGQTDEGS